MAKDTLTHAEELTLCRIHHGERFWGEASVLQSLEAKGMLRRYKHTQPDGSRWSLTKKALEYCRVPNITTAQAEMLEATRDGVFRVIPQGPNQIYAASRLRALGCLRDRGDGSHGITRRGKAALNLHKHELGEAARRR